MVYFHHAEEGTDLGFFSPPNKLVKHIAVTPKLLYEFALIGKWDLVYPEHQLPKRSHQIFNQAFVVILFLIVLYFSLKS